MALQQSVTNALARGAVFVAMMLSWILITGVVYGAFILVWPDIPDVGPWHHLGV